MPTIEREKKAKYVATKRRASTKSASQQGHMAAPQKLKLLITVVNRGKTESFMDLIQSFGANMQFCTTAHGTATSDILSLMGIEDNQKRVIFSVIREDMAQKALSVLEEKFATLKNGKGIAMTVPLTGVIGVAIYQFLCDNRRAKGGEV